MGKMNDIGEKMAKKPAIPLLIVLIVTIASLGMIAIEPPAFNMDEDSFAPDNDITKAATAVSEAFNSSASVMSTVDASAAGGDIFTIDVFFDTLRYEERLYGMEYTDRDGVKHPYTSDPRFGIISPIYLIASELTGKTLRTDIITDLGLYTDADVKKEAYDFFAIDKNMPYFSMLTKNASIDKTAETVSAMGCIINLNVSYGLVDESIVDGMVGFEKDVMAVAETFKSDALTKVKIDAVDLNVMMNEIGEMASDDMSNLIPIALILIVVILLLMYRDVVDMIIGILGLLIAIIWTFGISIAIGLEMTTIAIAVPILLMGLGIDYGLHLVLRYREERTKGNDSEKASGETVNSVGEALVLATVTTAIAFLSYLTSSMAALADFGAMCAIGIVCAFVAMLLLVPAMQSIRDRKTEKKGKSIEDLKRYRKSENKHGDIIGQVAGVGGRLSAKSPWIVLGVTCIALVGFGVSATNLTYEFDMYSFIPDGTEASETLNYMNDNYSTTTDTANVMVYGDPWSLTTLNAIEDTLEKLETEHIEGLSYLPSNGLDSPGSINGTLAYLAAVPGTDPAYISAYDGVFDSAGKVKSSAVLADVFTLRVVCEMMMTDPQLKQLFSQVIGEYDGERVTQIVLNITPEAAEGGDAAIAVRDNVDALLAETFGPTGIKALTTGTTIVMAVTLEEMNDSQMSSLILTLLLVLIILTIAMYYTDRSWWLGLMSTIPTLVSVILVWGTMALLGIPLNVLTLTIASLTVGMGVTYGIHISHRFVTELREKGCNPRDAIMTATRETGKGVFGAALTTAVGFGVIGFSAILPMQQFGMITALAIAFGYIGATFILPALLVVWGEHTKPKVCEPQEPSETVEA